MLLDSAHQLVDTAAALAMLECWAAVHRVRRRSSAIGCSRRGDEAEVCGFEVGCLELWEDDRQYSQKCGGPVTSRASTIALCRLERRIVQVSWLDVAEKQLGDAAIA